MTLARRLTRLALDRRLFRPTCDSVDRAPVRLKTAADMLAVVGQQINAVRADVDAGPREKARLIASLAAVGLKAVQTGNLEARVDMLEAVLKHRDGGGKR